MDRDSAGTILQYIRRIARPDGGPDASDAQLLGRFISCGDEDAFASLVQRHGPMVLGVCRRIVFHAQDVEDAFQATFMVLVRKASRIVRRELLASWLYGVAIRTAIKARANAAKRRTREVLVPDLPEAEAPGESAWKSIRHVLDEEVGRLPTKYRTPFTLCYLQGLTNEEAARQLGCPKGTLQSRLAWARDRLRSRLTRRGVALSAGLLSLLLSEKCACALVPTTLVDKTVKLALAFGGWKAAAGTVSAPAVHLAQGVLQAMFFAKLKIVAIIALVGILMGAGTGVWMYQAPAAEPVPDAQSRDDKPARKEPAKPARSTDRFKAEAVIQKSLQTGAAPHVVVEMFNGPIEIKEGANRKVDATVTKQSNALSQKDADEELENVDVSITQDGDAVHIKAKRKVDMSLENAGSGASAVVEVPAGAILELHSSNGGVTIRGGKGGATVETSNGHIGAHGHKGALRLTTSNSPITISDGTGKMELHTTNGGINVKAQKAVVTARTANSPIRFEGTFADGTHTFETANSGIHVALPANTQFRLEADTSNGTVISNFASDDRRGGSHVRGRKLKMQSNIGDDPAISLKLRTSNGNITIDKLGE